MIIGVEEDFTADPLAAALATYRSQVPTGYEARLGEASMCSSCGQEIRLRHVGDDLCLWIADGESADTESRCTARSPRRPAELRPTHHHARNRLQSYHYSAVVRS